MNFSKREAGKKSIAIGCLLAFVIIIAIGVIIQCIDESTTKKEKMERDDVSFERASSLLQSSEKYGYEEYERISNELGIISSSHKKYNEAQILKQKADSLLSEKSYEQGKIFFDKGEYGMAESILKKVNSKHKKYEEAKDMIIKASNALNEQNYKLGEKFFDEGKYAEALPFLKKVNNKYKDYNKVKGMIVNANEVIKITASALLLSDYIQGKENMKVKSVSSSVFQSDLKKLGITALQQYVFYFGATAKAIKECEDFQNYKLEYLNQNARSKLKKDLQRLTTQARNNLRKEQRAEFPLLRKEFAKIINDTSQKSKGIKANVRTSGSGNSHLEYIGVAFANEAIIDEYQKILVEEGVTNFIKLFRFKRVVYKWSEYDREYSYYSYNTPADDVEVNENTMGEIKK